MVYLGFIIYFLLMLADTILTLGLIKMGKVYEKNKFIARFISKPAFLYLIQVTGTLAIVALIWFVYLVFWHLGLVLLFACIIIRGRVVWKNYLIFKRLNKKSIKGEVNGFYN
jgi:FlaA1/EpsC-like NDP-sugar epimerase